MSNLYKELPKSSLPEIIIQRIVDAIINGDLHPGDKIPTEMEFSENLGVSRNVVREAIKVLVAFGVLEIKRAEGTFVVQEYNSKLLNPMIYGIILSKHTLNELLEFKLVISGAILHLAISKATDDGIATLDRWNRQFRMLMHSESVDIDQAYNATLEYKNTLVQIGNNPMLTQLDHTVHQLAIATRYDAIRASIEMDCRDALADNYDEEIALIKQRSQDKISQFMDKRLQLWKKLLT